MRAVLGVCFALLVGGAAAQAQPADGQVSPQAVVLDANYRGAVTFTGSYQGQVADPRRQRSQDTSIVIGGHRIPIPGAIPDALMGPKMQTIQGAITFDLQFEGGRVTGRFNSNGALHSSNLRGSVSNGVCSLYEDDGSLWRGRCDSYGFTGDAGAKSGGNEKDGLRFTTTVERAVDFNVRDRQLAELRANQARAQAARAASLSPLARTIDRVLQADSSAWMANRYDVASVTGERVLSREKHDKSGLVAANYTYNNGSTGWIKVKLVEGAISCVEYWDFQGECRPVGHPYSHALVASLAVAAMSAPSGGGSSYSGDSVRRQNDAYIDANRRVNEERDRARENDPN